MVSPVSHRFGPTQLAVQRPRVSPIRIRWRSPPVRGRDKVGAAMEMDSSSKAAALELFDVGPCEEPFRLGYLVGRKFSSMIQSRAAADLVLQRQLLPFARTPQAEPLIQAICSANRQRFPAHWEELLGTAEGSGVPVLHVNLPAPSPFLLHLIPRFISFSIPQVTSGTVVSCCCHE